MCNRKCTSSKWTLTSNNIHSVFQVRTGTATHFSGTSIDRKVNKGTKPWNIFVSIVANSWRWLDGIPLFALLPCRVLRVLTDGYSSKAENVGNPPPFDQLKHTNKHWASGWIPNGWTNGYLSTSFWRPKVGARQFPHESHVEIKKSALLHSQVFSLLFRYRHFVFLVLVIDLGEI